MSRLIDADTLNIEQLFDTKNKSIPVSQYINYLKGIEAVEKIIKNAPTVEERKHGYWIDDGTECVTCSVCGIEIDYHYRGYKYSPDCGYEYVECKNYCGNCGAIMDEVKE